MMVALRGDGASAPDDHPTETRPEIVPIPALARKTTDLAVGGFAVLSSGMKAEEFPCCFSANVWMT
ncbi:MAG: hypothetical protein KGN39_10015 [Betaproteobacteria bacterium]|nr:hypothetical protein [Betaproteobacteria bacterium]